MDDHRFRKLLDELGYSWEGYRRVRKGVMKRLTNHMHRLDIRSADGYLDRVRSEPEIRREVRLLLTVSISRFFRDRPLWAFIQETVIPHMIWGNPPLVRAWSAGCALGQEAYSFKMVWLLYQEERGPLPPLSLMATDINEDYLNRAARGIYEKRVLRDVPEAHRKKFFVRHPDHYGASEALKENIAWRVHDLCGEEPAAHGFDLIFMRNNILTYLNKEQQRAPVEKVINALAPGGFLIIGDREHISDDDGRLVEVQGHPCVRRKLPA